MPRRKSRHSRWRRKDAPAPQENLKRLPLKPRPDAYKKISGAFRKEEAGKPRRNSIHSFGAGEGNRTLLASLEGWSITTMLHPHGLRMRLYYTSDFKIDKPPAMKKYCVSFQKTKRKKANSCCLTSCCLTSFAHVSRPMSHVKPCDGVAITPNIR